MSIRLCQIVWQSHDLMNIADKELNAQQQRKFVDEQDDRRIKNKRLRKLIMLNRPYTLRAFCRHKLCQVIDFRQPTIEEQE